MKNLLAPGTTIMPRKRWRGFLAGLLALGLTVPLTMARAADVELSKEDAACLKCHDKEGEAKKLENGEILSLHISTKAYLESRHNETSCEDCHDSIDAKTHGKTKAVIKSKREYALTMKDACLTCHKKPATQYQDSVHATMVKEGSDKAPLCSNCHNPHTVKSVKLVTPIAETPCASCHEDIFKAYAGDVHGLERAAKGKIAPLCSDCHKAHDVKAASLGDGVKDACIACHKEAVAEHKDWLPNTERHFAAISCPACHAPTAHRRVNLRLYDGKAGQQVAEKSGVPQFERLAQAADVTNVGLDERALWSMLKEFNQDGVDNKTTLRGRLEVRSGAEAHQLSEKSKAIKDCKTCHQAGAAAFQSVSLTIAGPDGRPLRHGVQKDVLSSLTSMGSVRGFYAIGATRIKLLDYLFVLVLVGSISVPLVHMTVKWMFRRVRAKVEAERRAAAPATAGPDSPGDRRAGDDASR